jgi:hypothetical protein
MGSLADEGAPMRRLLHAALAGVIMVIASAHVGSPDVVYDGNAGPYALRVIVRPPSVVPGLAEVIVRVLDSGVTRIVIRPVYWRAGVAGAPEGDEAKPVAGALSTYRGQLWLMARGAYSVYVTAEGAKGSGTAIVPVMSVATGRLGFSPLLASLLAVLGVVLVAGLLSLVHAAAGASLVEPGDAISPSRRRRARLITVAAIPVLALMIFGGARWWQSVDTDYQRTMFHPPTPTMRVQRVGTQQMLELSTRDAGERGALGGVIPDHGKIMHMFLISDDGMTTFAHLHPSQIDSETFRVQLPSLAPGPYHVFADVVTETGSNLTLTSTVTLPAPAPRAESADSDDAWTHTPTVPVLAQGVAAPLGDGGLLVWSGDSGAIAAGRPIELKFVVRDADGREIGLRPYLGMAGHAVIVRSDDSVFIHLHPMGTVSIAAQQVFALRDRGDTTRSGRVRLGAAPPSASMPMMPLRIRDSAPLSGAVSFPYEFPKPGRYRLWVQLKPGNHVRTGTFDVIVH